jgi:uncharacterized protein YecT (DUF1311 family)
VKRPVLFCAAIAACLPAVAQRNESAASNCYMQPSHAEARDCLTLKRQESEATLRKAESAALKPHELQLASRKFAAYRHAQCEWQAALADGGNAASDRRLLCEIELNERRAAELKGTGKGPQ